MPSTCNMCHRALKDPVSVERGYGPICWAKLLIGQGHIEESEATYDGGDIILRRVNGSAVANVPHVIKFHSPSGFEWGYGGSGPADLALNILYAITGDRELAMQYHQQFKWDFIARVPREGGVIKRDDILKWLEGKGIYYENSGIRG